MPEIIVKPDTSWGLECIRERFEIPFDAVPDEFDTPAQRAFKVLFIESCAKKSAEKAIETYEKFRHWKFRADMPVELDESELQLDIDDWEFTSPLSKDPIAKNQGHLKDKASKKAYVVKLWFEVPQIQAVVFTPDTPEEEVHGVFGPESGMAYEDEVWENYNTPDEPELKKARAEEFNRG